MKNNNRKPVWKCRLCGLYHNGQPVGNHRPITSKQVQNGGEQNENNNEGYLSADRQDAVLQYAGSG